MGHEVYTVLLGSAILFPSAPIARDMIRHIVMRNPEPDYGAQRFAVCQGGEDGIMVWDLDV